MSLGYGPDQRTQIFRARSRGLRKFSLEGFEVTLPVEVDARLDQGVFYYRFLESLMSTWWLEQAIDLTEKLGLGAMGAEACRSRVASFADGRKRQADGGQPGPKRSGGVRRIYREDSFCC